MTVRHFLDASSGHLSPETWAWLAEQTVDDVVRDPRNRSAGILGGRTRHGWFIYAPEEPDATIPADLAALLRHARGSRDATTPCWTVTPCRWRTCRSGTLTSRTDRWAPTGHDPNPSPRACSDPASWDAGRRRMSGDQP